MVVFIKCYSGDQIRRMGWAGHTARMGERSGVYRVMVEKREEKETIWKTKA